MRLGRLQLTYTPEKGRAVRIDRTGSPLRLLDALVKMAARIARDHRRMTKAPR